MPTDASSAAIVGGGGGGESEEAVQQRPEKIGNALAENHNSPKFLIKLHAQKNASSPPGSRERDPRPVARIIASHVLRRGSA
jgi:hypothetical protein